MKITALAYLAFVASTASANHDLLVSPPGPFSIFDEDGCTVTEVDDTRLLRQRQLAPPRTNMVRALGACGATLYSDRTEFQAALQGNYIVDDYSDSAYAEGDVINGPTLDIHSDEYMSSILGEVVYSSTGFSDWNLIIDDHTTQDPFYCAGCNGSFNLDFKSTSVGTADGVAGVGFDIKGVSSTWAFVTFGDGCTENFYIAGDSNYFYGITAPTAIAEIHFGLEDGESSMNIYMELDTLTFGGILDPNCAQAGFLGGTLPCQNTQAFGGQDAGCSYANPVCVSDETREIASHTDGSYCAKCVNDQQADNVADQGCPANKPRCVCGDITPDLWFAGSECVAFEAVCVNNGAYGANDQDCLDDAYPLCVRADGGPLYSWGEGSMCVKCVNNMPGNSVDEGCSAGAPRCVNMDYSEPDSTFGGMKCV